MLTYGLSKLALPREPSPAILQVSATQAVRKKCRQQPSPPPKVSEPRRPGLHLVRGRGAAEKEMYCVSHPSNMEQAFPGMKRQCVFLSQVVGQVYCRDLESHKPSLVLTPASRFQEFSVDDTTIWNEDGIGFQHALPETLAVTHREPVRAVKILVPGQDPLEQVGTETRSARPGPSHSARSKSVPTLATRQSLGFVPEMQLAA